MRYLCSTSESNFSASLILDSISLIITSLHVISVRLNQPNHLRYPTVWIVAVHRHLLCQHHVIYAACGVLRPHGKVQLSRNWKDSFWTIVRDYRSGSVYILLLHLLPS